MKDIKYYIGPMSKNVVDAIIEFTEETDNKIGFIPSRRQVEYNGGYVNNWTTKEFAEYVNGRVTIERDHGGPGQGYKYDAGLKSFTIDALYLDMIHIDPWKVYPKYEDGLQSTISSIKRIYDMNPKILFEVGTEESIRPFTPGELERLLDDLSKALPLDTFYNIKYAVIQSGVGLDLGKRVNTGTFDEERLWNMIQACKEYDKLSKEHNGDYLSNQEIEDKFNIGLDALNIAPEFGQLETLCYLDNIGDDFEQFYQLCYKSKRWEKWVGKDFIPDDNKKELIKICGHYILSDENFQRIKPNIDNEIKTRIKNKLRELCQEI